MSRNFCELLCIQEAKKKQMVCLIMREPLNQALASNHTNANSLHFLVLFFVMLDHDNEWQNYARLVRESRTSNLSIPSPTLTDWAIAAAGGGRPWLLITND